MVTGAVPVGSVGAHSGKTFFDTTLPRVPTTLPQGLRFLTTRALPELFDFPVDMARVPVEINRLHTQALVRYYEREWNAINR